MKTRNLLSILGLTFVVNLGFSQESAEADKNVTSSSNLAVESRSDDTEEMVAGPDSHQAHYYNDKETGKLYWQKRMPVYLFVSPDADGTDVRKLESETTPEYANPLYLDTEGVNYIRTRWAVDNNGETIAPQQEIMFEIYADSYAPVTSLDFTAAGYSNSEQKYYGDKLTITASAKDQMSGLDNIYYSLNNASFQPVSGDIVVDEEGSHNLKIYSVDNVGNTEELIERSFVLDKKAPISTMAIDGITSDNIFSPKVGIEFTAEDDLSGVAAIYYQINEDEKKAYQSAIAPGYLSEGVHSLTYFAKDKVNNVEEERTYQFFMDKTPPTVDAKLNGDVFENKGNMYISERTMIELTSEDNRSGVEAIYYTIDDGEEKVYTSPINMGELSGGHSLSYYAVDKVRNGENGEMKTKYGKVTALNVDKVAPALSKKFEGPVFQDRDTTFINSNSKVSLLASDDESGVNKIAYTVNGKTESTYESALSFDEEGVYEVSFSGTDLVNNTSNESFFFVVDNSSPVITDVMSSKPIGKITLEDFEGDLQVYSKGVHVYLAASDEVIDTKNIFYTLNDGKQVKYGDPIVLNEKGINTLTVTAFDKLGNETADPLTLNVFIK